jgi:hypothetical protein
MAETALQHTPRYYTEWLSHWDRYDLKALRRVIDDENWSLTNHDSRARAAVVVYVRKSAEVVERYQRVKDVVEERIKA